MTIRQIKPEEKQQANKIDTIAFANSFDYSKEQATPPGYKDDYYTKWGAFTDSGVMTSTAVLIPFTVMFDGNEVKMGGLGGVASLPEYRGKGAVRGIFASCMKYMKENGQLFSYLYPFSYKYYRKFGYELCYERRIAKFAPTDLRERAPQGELTFFNQNDDITPYMDINRRFIEGFNLSIVRTVGHFNDFINRNPYKERRYTYLWHNDEGAPKAYLTFTAAAINEYHFRMMINEFAWTDPEGMHGILSHIGCFDAKYTDIWWEAPDTIDLFSLLTDPYQIEIIIERGGMNRIIDADKVLRLMNAPYGEGVAVVSVKDSFLDWNNKTFAIEWANAALEVTQTLVKPDIEVDIGILTLLVCGYYTPDKAEASGKLLILNNRENLNRLFYKKNLYITDRF